ncbi:unnamed protein product, partial [Gongylonema pulchrum]|uniref:Uncharacterized protein n=1 Tax=Gongylonema pulchrum TaxID=637853 RepID=A0A183ELW8_9BILA
MSSDELPIDDGVQYGPELPSIGHILRSMPAIYRRLLREYYVKKMRGCVRCRVHVTVEIDYEEGEVAPAPGEFEAELGVPEPAPQAGAATDEAAVAGAAEVAEIAAEEAPVADGAEAAMEEEGAAEEAPVADGAEAAVEEAAVEE